MRGMVISNVFSSWWYLFLEIYLAASKVVSLFLTLKISSCNWESLILESWTDNHSCRTVPYSLVVFHFQSYSALTLQVTKIFHWSRGQQSFFKLLSYCWLERAKELLLRVLEAVISLILLWVPKIFRVYWFAMSGSGSITFVIDFQSCIRSLILTLQLQPWHS